MATSWPRADAPPTNSGVPQLCTLRFLGTFLTDPLRVPAVVVQTLAEQLHLPADALAAYRTRPNTWYDHQARIVAHLGYTPFDGRQTFRLTRWLYAQVLTSTVRPSVLFDLTTAHLVAQRVVLPGVSLLARLIARVRERTGRHLYRQLRTRLNPSQQAALETLLTVPAGERLTHLERLRTPPTRVSAPALAAALRRVGEIRALGVSAVPVADLPEARLARLARHAQLAWAQTLVRMGEERRLATLLVFAQTLERTATDDVLDLFDSLLTSLALRGETKRRRERLRSLKDLDQAALLLQQAVELLLDEAVPAGQVRQQVFDRLGQAPLRAAAATAGTSQSAGGPAGRSLERQLRHGAPVPARLAGRRRLRGDAHRQTAAGGLGLFAAAGSRRSGPPEVVGRAPHGRPEGVGPAGVSRQRGSESPGVHPLRTGTAAARRAAATCSCRPASATPTHGPNCCAGTPGKPPGIRWPGPWTAPWTRQWNWPVWGNCCARRMRTLGRTWRSTPPCRWSSKTVSRSSPSAPYRRKKSPSTWCTCASSWRRPCPRSK